MPSQNSFHTATKFRFAFVSVCSMEEFPGRKCTHNALHHRPLAFLHQRYRQALIERSTQESPGVGKNHLGFELSQKSL